MNHLHKYLALNQRDVLKIHLSNPAQVMLLDDKNYSLYKDEMEYDFYGKLAKRSPFIIKAPHAGNWHLVIEQADSGQDLSVNVQIISEY
jgi:hypothetical protein